MKIRSLIVVISLIYSSIASTHVGQCYPFLKDKGDEPFIKEYQEKCFIEWDKDNPMARYQQLDYQAVGLQQMALNVGGKIHVKQFPVLLNEDGDLAMVIPPQLFALLDEEKELLKVAILVGAAMIFGLFELHRMTSYVGEIQGDMRIITETVNVIGGEMANMGQKMDALGEEMAKMNETMEEMQKDTEKMEQMAAAMNNLQWEMRMMNHHMGVMNGSVNRIGGHTKRLSNPWQMMNPMSWFGGR